MLFLTFRIVVIQYFEACIVVLLNCIGLINVYYTQFFLIYITWVSQLLNVFALYAIQTFCSNSNILIYFAGNLISVKQQQLMWIMYFFQQITFQKKQLSWLLIKHIAPLKMKEHFVCKRHHSFRYCTLLCILFSLVMFS